MGIDIIYVADINVDSESIGRIATKDLQLERSFDGNVTYFISIGRLLLQFLHMRVGSQVFIFFHLIFFLLKFNVRQGDAKINARPKLDPHLQIIDFYLFICHFKRAMATRT